MPGFSCRLRSRCPDSRRTAGFASVVDGDTLDIGDARIRSSVRFISFEPLLGPIRDVDLSGISWAIVGGESGPDARPMHPDWAIDLRDRCLSADTAFFFKQWGGIRPKAGGRLLDGREWNGMPGSPCEPHDADGAVP